MKIARFGDTERSNAARRLVGRMAAVGLLSTGSVLLLSSHAFATGSDLPSTILANSIPGLVPTPLGNENGPITQSNVGLVLGSDNGASSSLGQSLADGAVTAYIRSWNRQPPNGDAVVITAFEFKTAPDESSFMDDFDSQLQNDAGNTPFAVSGIPGASGAEVHTTTSGISSSEYIVSFAKGNTAFQVVVATSSGDLTSANAVSLANQQFANAPDVPASGSGANWHLLPGVPLVGVVLYVAIVAIGRKRKYPVALRGLPTGNGHHWAPPAVPSPGLPAGYSSPAGPVPSEQRPKVGADQWQ
jgi:hypothetical protein